jgi:hypothetical protein
MSIFLQAFLLQFFFVLSSGLFWKQLGEVLVRSRKTGISGLLKKTGLSGLQKKTGLRKQTEMRNEAQEAGRGPD